MTTRRITSSSITSGGGGATVRYQPEQPVGITPGELWVDSDGDTDVVDAETFLTKESASASYVYKSGDTITGPTVITINSSSDALRITQEGSGNVLVVEDSTNPDGTPVVIDNSGKLVVGHTSSISNYSSEINSNDGLSVNRWSNDENGPYVDLRKSKSGTTGSYSVVSSGDDVGYIRFLADDGDSFVEAARIQTEVDGTPGPNDMPGRLIFSTTADGQSTPTERMRIDSSGVVQFLNYGAGTLSTNASGVISASDGRYKTKTRTVENGLESVLALEPTYFRWNESSEFYNEYEELGFIAQEVAEVIPEASPGEDEEDTFRNYHDRAIIAMLVQGMKEQQAQINDLTSRLDAAGL